LSARKIAISRELATLTFALTQPKVFYSGEFWIWPRTPAA